MCADRVKEFYPEDLVYKFDAHKRIKFGTISDTYEGSVGSEGSLLQKGHVLIAWHNSPRQQVCRQSKVRLLSRSVIPGDVVRRLEDGKETQRGYCKSTRQTTTVQVVETNKMVDNVLSQRLNSVMSFEIVGNAVCLGSKFGRIQGVEQLIKMHSRCGSVVEVSTDNNRTIRDVWSKDGPGNLNAIYPGQAVICVPMHLTRPTWIKRTKSMQRKMENLVQFRIESVQTHRVTVWWHLADGNIEFASITKREDIAKLKVLPYIDNVQMSDRHLLKLKPSDVLLSKHKWLKKKSQQYFPNQKAAETTLAEPAPRPEPTISEDNEWLTDEDESAEATNITRTHNYQAPRYLPHRKGHFANKSNKFASDALVPVEVVCIESKATIVWQDGSEEKDIPTTELYYFVSLEDHEFFPGEWVVKKNNNNKDTCGVVQKVDFMERTAEVKWFEYPESAEVPNEVVTDELSVYDLQKHVKFAFRPGSVVRKKLLNVGQMGKVIDSCPVGYVLVQWVDGVKQMCWPRDIELISEGTGFSFPDDFDSGNEMFSDDFSWETESEESFEGDVTDDVNLQTMAVKVDFLRNRFTYLAEAFKEHNNINKNIYFVKDLLCIYDNCAYLDKYLDTSFFCLESRHFQAILKEAKEKAKVLGIELSGRLFSKENLVAMRKRKSEEDNIEQVIKLQSKVNAQIGTSKEGETPEEEPSEVCHENLCVELLAMLKIRMDLAYAEIINRIGGPQALTVLTNISKTPMHPSASTVLELPIAPVEEAPKPPPKKEPAPQTVDVFSAIEEAPSIHRYFKPKCEPKDLQKFLNVLQKEYKLLKESLPDGVWVKTFDDRIDLLSVMIRGPDKTPYEDGLFLFDIQFSVDYPRTPPLVQFISFLSEALNPNLYVEGKVCVSLLGTWMGKGSEVWGSSSTLLQLIVSIQGLILVAEPYYNEAGYDKQMSTQQGYENARTYNEFVILKVVQAMNELVNNLPEIFKSEVLYHCRANGERMYNRLLKFCEEEVTVVPDFSLLPVSKGLKLSLKVALATFQKSLNALLNRDDNGILDTEAVS